MAGSVNTWGQPISTGGGTPVPQGGAAGTVLPTYTATPSTPATPTPTPSSYVPTTPANGGTSTSLPGSQPQSESDIYAGYVSQGQQTLDAINASVAAQNAQIDQSAGQAQQNQNALAAITGGFGSTAVSGATQISQNATTQKNQVIAQGAQQTATYLNQLQQLAQTQANTEQSAYYSQVLPQASQIITGLQNQGLTFQQLSTNPALAQTYQNLLSIYGGDPNALSATFANATPAKNVLQSWTQGSTMYQVVQNPTTGAISVNQVDTGVAIPTGWTSTKIGTTGQLFQDPSNPNNTIIYQTNPLTGGITVSGTGTGSAIAAQYNQTQGDTTSSSTSASTPTGESDSGVAATDGGTFANFDSLEANAAAYGNIVSNAAQGTSTPYGSSPTLQSFLTTYANLGSNNTAQSPYVSRFLSALSSSTGQDVGTLASQLSQPLSQVVSSVGIQNMYNAQVSAEGGSAAGVQNNPANIKYLSSTDSAPVQTGTNGLPTAEYGLLSNVQGFDPGTPGTPQTAAQATDSFAFNYLKSYLSGQTPSSTSGMGGSTTYAEKQDIQSRAQQLYFQATGQNLPNATTLSNNLDLIKGNNALLNSLKVQEGTITANSDLLQSNINAQNINQNAPVINSIINGVQNMLGNSDVASYLAQNSTISNELGSLLALKNASGTTVHDKLISAGLIDPSASAAQEASVVNRLMQEAVNAHGAITNANIQLYAQTDPLQIDPANPLNNTMNFLDPQGNATPFGPGSLTAAEVQTLIDNGYSMQ